MRLAWSNRIALLGVAMGVSSFVGAVLYAQLSSESHPRIEGLPFKPNCSLPACPTQGRRQAIRFHDQAKQYEKEGQILEAGQCYANAARTTHHPKDIYELNLWEDYAEFLHKYGATAAGDQFKKEADHYRPEIMLWELKYKAPKQTI